MKRNLVPLLLILAASLACQCLAQVLPPYVAAILMLAGINAVLAVSLNVVTGLSGQFSLGHAGFMAIGAYVSAAVTTPQVDALRLAGLCSSPAEAQALFALSLLLAALAAGAAGTLVGLPSLRLKGDYLAIVTLGFGEIIRIVILNINCVGGARGLSGVPGYSSAFAVALVLFASVWLIHRFVGSSQGRALLAIREDEIAASGLGISATRYKVGAFVASSALAGVAGGLFAHYLCYLNPSSFGFMKSVEIVIMVVLGGMGSISGSALAALLLTLLPEALRPLQQWTGLDLRMVLYSLMLIALMLLRPQGLFGTREVWQWLPGRKRGEDGRG